jgi:hypothetical protein
MTKMITERGTADQNWADYNDDEGFYDPVWQKGQWCPPGLRKSQKRRVQRLRNKELKGGCSSEDGMAPERET